MGMSASQARLLQLTARLSDLELQAQQISNAKIRLSQDSEAAATAYSDALNKETLKVYSGTSDGNSTYVQATAYNLTTYGAVSTTDKQRFLKDSSGKVIVSTTMGKYYDDAVNAGGSLATQLSAFLASNSVVTDKTNSSYDASQVKYYTNIFNEIKDSGYNSQQMTNLTDSQWLYDQLNTGNISLYEWNSTAGADGTGDFVSTSWTSGDATLTSTTDDTNTAKAEAEYEATTAKIETKDKRFDMELSSIDTEHTAIQTEVDSVKKIIDKNIERSFKVFNA